MSDTVSIFVGNGPSIAECRRVVENHLQIPLVHRADMDSMGYLFVADVSGVTVSLFNNHGLDDDCEIEFTRFPLEIDFTRYAGTTALDWNEATFRSLVLSLAQRLSIQFKTPCIVVDNLQVIVQSFGTSAG
jgi:hypothetical protein